MNKFIFIFLIFIVMLQQFIFAETENNTYINTSNITYDEEKNIVELSKNSKINISDTNILVDKGIIDYNKNNIEIFGDFYLYQELNILSGKNLKGDIKLNDFEAYDVSYIYNDDLKIDSEKAKRSKNIITFYNNFLTPCELEGYFNCPTWSLRIDKTEYNIDRDKFNHFDSFFQIADYKLFYLPYFSHYGSKAPRQKGFLTPTIEYNIKGTSGIKVPYYYPINSYTEIDFTPTISINENFDLLENYHLNTEFNQKLSGGRTKITLDNVKKENNNNINSTLKFNTKQIVSKKTIVSANTQISNSISTTRSINEEPIRYEDIYFRIENYNLVVKNDYLNTEISTVESFDNTTVNQIPLAPNLKYHNKFDFENDTSLFTDVNYRILNRNSSTDANPKENYVLNLNNFYFFNEKRGAYNYFNKVSLYSSINDYRFEHDPKLNRQESKSSFTISSDVFFNYNLNIKPRIKLIHYQDIIKSNGIINEDSSAITFNYINQFSDNRFFGNNLGDNSSRIIYGFENNFKIKKQRFNININQSYDLNKEKNYAKKINQSSNYSDYALEAKTSYKDLIFKVDARIDEDTLNKKEMSYSLDLKKPISLNISYHETDKDSYEIVSNDTKSMILGISNNINENISLSYNSNLDLKNNYSPYSELITLSFFDECSKLDIEYSNKRFNDNFNTKPEEKLSLNFYMDYLDFFGFKDNNNIFRKK
jgi:LPS-assembly protein